MGETYNVAVVGAQVGKSRLLCRFLYDSYEDVDDPTVEDSYTKGKYVVDDVESKLILLDTSGNDFYADLYGKWFGGSEGFIVIYSLTSTYSFDAVPHFVEQIQKVKNAKTFPMVLVATQADLAEKSREVTEKEGLSVAYRYKCPFLEVSSLTGEKVDDVFKAVVQELRKAKALKAGPLDNPDKMGQVSMQGTGMMKNWKKIVLVLKDGIMYFFPSNKEYQDNKPMFTVNLMTCTVKPAMMKDKNCFDLISVQRNYSLQTDTKEEMAEWIAKIQDGILSQLNTVTSVKEMKQVEVGRTPEDEWRLIQQVSPTNCVCADCDSPDPDWCSINLGVLVCIQCSGVHRSLGVHITKVRSLTLDKLDPEIYAFMKFVGNEKANKIWEANVPSTMTKPVPKDDRAKKEKWIREKYVNKTFVPKVTGNAADLPKQFYAAVGNNDLWKAMTCYAQSKTPMQIIDWVNTDDECGTPLHKAAVEGHVTLAVWLVQTGCKLDAVDKKNRTALDVAREMDSTEVEQWLSKKGVPTNVAPNSPQAPPAASQPPPRTLVTEVQKKHQTFNELVNRRLSINEIAKTVYKGDQINKKEIGSFIGESGQLNSQVLFAFVNCADYAKIPIDEGLRKFLVLFAMPANLATAENIMSSWAVKYFSSNANSIFAGPGTVYILAWFIILLHLNLHVDESILISSDQSGKINKAQFVKSCSNISGDDLPKDYLEAIFDRVSRTAFDMDTDDIQKVLKNTEKTGYLTKEGGRRKTWKKRWFVLNKDELAYYKSPSDSEPKGIVPLISLKVGNTPFKEGGKRKYCFVLDADSDGPLNASKRSSNIMGKSNHERFVFSAETDEIRKEWIATIQIVLNRTAFYQRIYENAKTK